MSGAKGPRRQIVDYVPFLCEKPGTWFDEKKRVRVEDGRRGWTWKFSGGEFPDTEIYATMRQAASAAVTYLKEHADDPEAP